MATRANRTFLRQFQTLFNLGVVQSLTDGQLLERFATGGGERAELAFAALVERHAALVLRVCQAQLGDSPEAHDAFQATFLVLMKKARSLWVRDSIGPWLHQVAYRTSLCSRTTELRRRRLQRMVAVPESYEIPEPRGWESALHEEVNRLPERYRVPIVLCDFQGYSCEEAARRMGRPVGTVKSWRSRGRDRLRQRLIRLGVVPASLLADEVASGGGRRMRSQDAVIIAVRQFTDGMTAGTVPASVGWLVKGVLKAMIFGKLRMTAVVIVATFSLLGGLGTLAAFGWQEARPSVVEIDEPTPTRLLTPKDKQDHPWALTLPEAIRISLANSFTIRIEEPAAGVENEGVIRVTPKDTETEPYRFKSELMAHVRSVEQQYWALRLQEVAYWAAETAVDLTEQIVNREQAKLDAGTGNRQNLAEAAEQLERFRLDFVDKTANLITTERQLRRILGLPAAGNSRITTVTAPTRSEVKPVWDECLKTLLEMQPDLQRARAAISGRKEDASDLQKELLRDVRQQAEHSLARMSLEVDSNYKLFQTAERLQNSARDRLDAGAAFFETGQLSIDRYLDAVNRWARAVAQKEEFLSRYNTAMVALEEAKGSLLEEKGIVVTESPRRADLHDRLVEPTVLATSTTKPSGPMPIRSTPLPAEKTFSFQLSIGAGTRPLEIRASFSISGSPAQTSPVRGEPESR